jgi:hypothetical protein
VTELREWLETLLGVSTETTHRMLAMTGTVVVVLILAGG